MPSPVEALPCGSRSMISTSSPIAARAVPRLMAVVVLPTPPFWLARARMRGWLMMLRPYHARGPMTFRSPDDDDAGGGSVTLGINSASILQDLRESVNSRAASWPFGNSPTAPAVQRGSLRARSSGSGASARAVTTSTIPSSVARMSRSARHERSAGRPVSRDGLAQEARFAPVALDEVDLGDPLPA